MATPESNPSWGHWRVWLKGTVESGLLDRLPPRFDPDGSGHRPSGGLLKDVFADPCEQ